MRQELLSDALREAYRSIPEWYGVDFETFKSAANDWECFPIAYLGKPIGMVFRRGTELHVSIPKGHNSMMSREPLRIINETLKRYGKVTTVAHKNDFEAIAMIERKGFILTGSRGDFLNYTKE